MNSGKIESQDSISTSKELSIVSIHNPLCRDERDTQLVPYCGLSLTEIANKYLPADVDFIVSINGEIIPTDLWGYAIPQCRDVVVFMPEVGDFGKVIGAALIAVAIIGMVLAPEGFVVWETLSGMGYGVTFTAAAYYAAIAVGMALIVSSFLLGQLPDMPTITDTSVSQTYGWAPATIQKPGTMIPAWFGRNKLRGNVIATYIEYDGTNEWINALLSFGYGPFSECELDSIKLNDREIANFSSMYLHYRNGAVDQTPIPNFNDTVTYVPLNQKVTKAAGYVEYTVENDLFDGLEIITKFPRGIWSLDASGNLQKQSVDYKIEVQKEGTSEWILVTRHALDYETMPASRWSLGKYYPLPDNSKFWYENKNTDVPANVTEGLRQVGTDHQLYEWHYIVAGTPYTQDASSASIIYDTVLIDDGNWPNYDGGGGGNGGGGGGDGDGGSAGGCGDGGGSCA
jgi:uncharacterized membrane protein YgcG